MDSGSGSRAGNAEQGKGTASGSDVGGEGEDGGVGEGGEGHDSLALHAPPADPSCLHLHRHTCDILSLDIPLASTFIPLSSTD